MKRVKDHLIDLYNWSSRFGLTFSARRVGLTTMYYEYPTIGILIRRIVIWIGRTTGIIVIRTTYILATLLACHPILCLVRLAVAAVRAMLQPPQQAVAVRKGKWHSLVRGMKMLMIQILGIQVLKMLLFLGHCLTQPEIRSYFGNTILWLVTALHHFSSTWIPILMNILEPPV